MKLKQLFENKFGVIKTFDIELNDDLAPGYKDKSLIPLEKFIETHCSNVAKCYHANPHRTIWRGIKSQANAVVIDSDLYYRRSSNTSNIYTKLIDISSAWKDYAIRARSISCSTDRNRSDRYGEDREGNVGTTYLVLPFDNAKISYGLGSDFWDNFSIIGLNNLDTFNDLIIEIARYFKLQIKRDADAENNQLFIDKIKKIENRIIDYVGDQKTKQHVLIANLDDRLKLLVTSRIPDHFISGFVEAACNGNLIQFLVDLLDPKENDIRNTSSSEVYVIPKNREVWIQGKSLLISKHIASELELI